MIYQQQLPENLHMQMTGNHALCTEMADPIGHFKSRHGNPIHIFTEVETKAQYH